MAGTRLTRLWRRRLPSLSLIQGLAILAVAGSSCFGRRRATLSRTISGKRLRPGLCRRCF